MFTYQVVSNPRFGLGSHRDQASSEMLERGMDMISRIMSLKTFLIAYPMSIFEPSTSWRRKIDHWNDMEFRLDTVPHINVRGWRYTESALGRIE